MADWKTLSSEVVYETKWFKIRRDEVLNHNGKPMTYSYMDAAHPSVTIVAVNSEGKILLQQTFRYIVGKTFWELPAGGSDGESPITAAKRELMEEAGLASNDWSNLGRVYSALGTTTNNRTICVAQNVYPAAGERDEDEQITNQTFFTLPEIEAMIRDGAVESSGVLAALYLAKLHGLIKE